MKFLSSFIFLILMATSSFAADNFYPDHDATVYSEKFWTNVSYKKGSNEGTTSFRMIFEAPVDLVFNHLIDTNNFYKIHSNYVDSRSLSKSEFDKVMAAKPKNPDDVRTAIQDKRHSTLVNRNPRKKWNDYWFMQFNLPWPLSDKWTIQKAKVDESNSHKNEYKVEFKLVEGNIKSLKGWWQVLEVPGKPGWTEFRGESQSDPGIAVPKFIAKSSFRSSLKKEYEKNKEILAKKIKAQK